MKTFIPCSFLLGLLLMCFGCCTTRVNDPREFTGVFVDAESVDGENRLRFRGQNGAITEFFYKATIDHPDLTVDFIVEVVKPGNVSFGPNPQYIGKTFRVRYKNEVRGTIFGDDERLRILTWARPVN